MGEEVILLKEMKCEKLRITALPASTRCMIEKVRYAAADKKIDLNGLLNEEASLMVNKLRRNQMKGKSC